MSMSLCAGDLQATWCGLAASVDGARGLQDERWPGRPRDVGRDEVCDGRRFGPAHANLTQFRAARPQWAAFGPGIRPQGRIEPAGSSRKGAGAVTISVCLVDDQNLVRQGIRSLLELTDDMAVVAECVDGIDALAQIPRLRPDVVLLDLRMPNMSGIEVLQALATRGDLPPTIILTTFDDDQLVLQGLKAGAKGYLRKDVSLQQLVDAVRVVADGGSLVAPMVTQRLRAGVDRMQNQFSSLEQPDPLTERETEILRLLSGGYSNKEIANSLKVAEGTVKNHVSNILSKLGVRDRTRAVLKALELGIV